MRHRYLVLGLSVFIALALAVPALGGPSNPVATISASAKKTAKKALKKAKSAQTSADSAQSTADSAQSAATAAQSTADSANTNANGRLKSTSFVFGPGTADDGTSPKSDTASCPADTPRRQVTGGAFLIGGTDNADEAVIFELPYAGGSTDTWTVSAQEIDTTTPGSWALTAEAVCATTD